MSSLHLMTEVNILLSKFVRKSDMKKSYIGFAPNVPISLLKPLKRIQIPRTTNYEIKVKPYLAPEFAHKAFIVEDSMLFSYVLQLVLIKNNHKQDHSQRENVCCSYCCSYA